SLPLKLESNSKRAKLRVARELPLSPSLGREHPRSGRNLFAVPMPPPLKPQPDVRPRRRDKSQAQATTAIPRVPTQLGNKPSRNIRPDFNPQLSQNQRNRTTRRPQKRSFSPLVYIVRLLILGIGIGAIVGTLLSSLNPTSHASVKAKSAAEAAVQEQENSTASNSPTPLALSQEIGPLKAQIQTLVGQNSTLQPGIFIVDDSGAYVDWNGSETLAAASTIKLPILVAFFQDVDAGKIRLDEVLTLQQNEIASGSGNLQYQQPGTKFTALEVATKMMTISDNTATNMLITRLGGAEVLNQRFSSWGLTTTVLRNPLPDIEGTNTTSPKELSQLMSIVNQGNLVSMRSRDRILHIMQNTELNTLLPKGLGTGATIAHKTGNIGSLIADVGLVDMPTGKRYIIAVMVKRPHNDAKAQELIRQISRTVYDFFNQPSATPTSTLTPLSSPTTVSEGFRSESFLNDEG
ncbi:MAG TPA: serine hydrolase, partial [Coleofasciculaceae cyanobacterium]